MLVLSRKPGERITIGNAIELVVLGIEGGRIRLGINAPPEHRILRSEKLPHPMKGTSPMNAAIDETPIRAQCVGVAPRSAGSLPLSRWVRQREKVPDDAARSVG